MASASPLQMSAVLKMTGGKISLRRWQPSHRYPENQESDLWLRNEKYSFSIVYKLSAHPLRAQILRFLSSSPLLVTRTALIVSPQLLVDTNELQDGGVVVVVSQGVFLRLLLLALVLTIMWLIPRQCGPISYLLLESLQPLVELPVSLSEFLPSSRWWIIGVIFLNQILGIRSQWYFIFRIQMIGYNSTLLQHYDLR